MAKPKSPKKTQQVKEQQVKDGASAQLPAIETGANPFDPAMEAISAPAAAEPRKSTARKTTKKPEIVKSESYSNLVPINLEDEIRQLAYLFSERRGFAPGHETEDWLAAEHEVLQRYHQHSA